MNMLNSAVVVCTFISITPQLFLGHTPLFSHSLALIDSAPVHCFLTPHMAAFQNARKPCLFVALLSVYASKAQEIFLSYFSIYLAQVSHIG
jgi:hypothetical protein